MRSGRRSRPGRIREDADDIFQQRRAGVDDDLFGRGNFVSGLKTGFRFGQVRQPGVRDRGLLPALAQPFGDQIFQAAAFDIW
jgi:hypothetical protein